jgi:MFS family permease
MAAGLAGVALAPSFGWFYAVGSVVAFGNGITFPAFTSLYSKACQAENAGELLGQSQAMATTGRIVGPMVGGWLMESVSLGSPFLVAGALMLMALALFHGLRDSLLTPERHDAGFG